MRCWFGYAGALAAIAFWALFAFRTGPWWLLAVAWTVMMLWYALRIRDRRRSRR